MSNEPNYLYYNKSNNNNVFQFFTSDDDIIVFVNGCFDILHCGHINLLKKASEYGTKLIVGINSDSSIKQLKGNNRPIQDQHTRCTLISELKCVDYVVLFNDTNVEKLLKEISPNIWVKGGDYSLEAMHQGERQIAEKIGTKIIFIKNEHNTSTTDLINKIKNEG